MIIEELLVKLGFFSDLKGLDAFKSKISGVKQSLFTFVGEVEAAGLTVASFFAHSLTGIDEQAKFSKQVGVTVEQLQELQYAANISGSSTDDLNASMRNLSKNIFEASEGVGGAVEVFGRLGVATTTQSGQLRPTLDVLSQLADKLKNLPASEQADFAARIGLSPSMVLLLQKGSAGIAQLRSEAQKLGVYSEKDAKKAEEYADSWRSLLQIFTLLKNQIALGLAPVFTDLVKEATEWLKTNKEMVTQDIGAVLQIVVYILEDLLKALNWVLNILGPVIDAFGGFKNVLELIAVGAGVKWLFALPKILRVVREAFRLAKIEAFLFDVAVGWPVLLAVAAFAALVLILQDVWVYLTGGDSALGHIIAKLSKVKQFFSNVATLVKDYFMGAFRAVEAFFDGVIESIEKKIDKIKSFFKTVGAKTKHYFNSSPDGVILNTPAFKTVPLTNSATVSNIVNNSNSVDNTQAPVANNTTFNITVSSDGSSKDLAQTIQRTLFDTYRQAQRNNSSPVYI